MEDSANNADLKKVIEHYERCLETHGESSRGVDWCDPAGQKLRFRILTAIADLTDCQVLDVGCGIGHLYDFLREEGVSARYEGCDVSEKMIACAHTRHPGVTFRVMDILSAPELPADSYDVVTASGVFLVRMDVPEDRWAAFVRSMISRMYELCRVGISFNVLSTLVDFREDRLYYCAPEEMFRFASSLSRYLVIRHDYPLYEYSVYIYKNPPWGGVRKRT